MSNNQESIVKAIRLATKDGDRAKTQQEMADRLGCSLSSLRRFEYDGSLPTQKLVLANLRKMARVAGLDVTIPDPPSKPRGVNGGRSKTLQAAIR
jgi:transcriptional regulator with XRE-family HTH domain